MRLDWLTLAFGCFDGHRLDLGAEGVHIVVGPNEAGKSTVRHAFGEFLYGIDTRTNYDFAVQNKSDLWLRAQVRGSNGAVVEAVRHKRAKDDLVTPDGAKIGAEAFAGLLGGVERREFEQNFAIDHEELLRGGRELLDGRGDASRALFEAQSGARLGAVLARINAEMDRLYKQRASLPTLNAAIARHGDARAQFRGATLKVADYEQLQNRVDNAEKDRRRTEEDLARQREEHSRLRRIQQALPGLVKHAQLAGERDAVLGAGPVARAETGEVLGDLRARSRGAEETAERAGLRLQRIQDQLAGLHLDLPLLDQAEAIDALHAQGAAVADAEEQAAKWRDEAAALRAEIAALGEPAGAATAELSAGLVARVEESRRAKAALDTETRTAEAQVKRRVTARDKAAKVLSGAPVTYADVTGLKALIRAVPAGLVERIAGLRADIAAEDAKIGRLQERHALPAGVHERPLPTLEQVTAHRDALDNATLALENARLWVRDVEDTLEQRRRDLQALLRTDAPPTEEELQAARRVRAEAWARVRGRSGGGALDGAPGDELPDFLPESESESGSEPATAAPAAAPDLLTAYESAVATADDLVDRIRREADRSARRLRLEVDIEADVADLDRKRVDAAERDVRLAEAEASWQNLWLPGGLPAPEPAAAPVLLAAGAEIRELADSLDRLRADLTGAVDKAEQSAARLRDALPAAAPSADLAELLALAEEEREVREAGRRKREKDEEKLTVAQDELAAAEADLADCGLRAADWAGQWAEVLRAHHLAGDPDDVLATLTAAAEIARGTEEVEAAEADAAAAERRVADHTSKVEAALAACGLPPLPEPGSRYTETAALYRRLEEQRAIQTKRGELSRQLDEVRAELADAELDRRAAEKGLAALLLDAGVPDVGALEDAVRRTAEAAELAARLQAVEDSLDGTGLTLAALRTEAAEWQDDPDRLAATLETAAAHLADREAEHGEQISALAELKKDLRAMDGSARAAEASERAAEELATVVEESEEYLRLFLARKVLLDCMEEYREQNQGPVLARAEDTFRALTAGRFDRLVADADDKGRFQLFARRAGGERVGVEGMSEGTRDQLYLALRLASLDRYAAAGRAMPLLLDDVFMTFDDGRARAGFGVLDRLADSLQVVLFTHHPHLAALAQSTLPEARVHVHELPAAAGAGADGPDAGLPISPAAAVPAQQDGLSHNVVRDPSSVA